AAARTAPLRTLADQGVPEGAMMLFLRQSGDPDGRDGVLGVAPLTDLSDVRFEESIRCDRVHMRGGRGLCLATRGRLPVEYVALRPGTRGARRLRHWRRCPAAGASGGGLAVLARGLARSRWARGGQGNRAATGGRRACRERRYSPPSTHQGLSPAWKSIP